MNLRPPRPERGALPSCATARDRQEVRQRTSRSGHPNPVGALGDWLGATPASSPALRSSSGSLGPRPYRVEMSPSRPARAGEQLLLVPAAGWKGVSPGTPSRALPSPWLRRDDTIRTCGPPLPKRMLYQAELHPESPCSPGERAWSRTTTAGVPGLEPGLAEPESAGLPITPYPKGVSIRRRAGVAGTATAAHPGLEPGKLPVQSGAGLPVPPVGIGSVTPSVTEVVAEVGFEPTISGL